MPGFYSATYKAMLTPILLIIFGYFMGSISAAILYARFTHQVDPRTVGSGNPGATNILRTQGKKAALIVLLGDILKGVIPVVIGHILHLPAFWLGLIALAAILGHLFPIYFGFKGGKGVATTLGVVIALNPLLGICSAITWLVVAGLFRYSSLASLVMAIALPGYAFLLKESALLPSMFIVAALVIIRHRKNIHNLILGKESKIGQKKKPE
jgi:acyl phosphate:glycerol-3-phosphate acyltransferase